MVHQLSLLRTSCCESQFFRGSSYRAHRYRKFPHGCCRKPSLLGTGCDEAVHAILDLMYAKAPYTVMQRAMHVDPTVSELLPTILGDLKSVG
jgi:hypothetical protein